MPSFYMFFKGGLSICPKITKCTTKRFFPSVNHNMTSHFFSCFHDFRAVWTKKLSWTNHNRIILQENISEFKKKTTETTLHHRVFRTGSELRLYDDGKNDSYCVYIFIFQIFNIDSNMN